MSTDIAYRISLKERVTYSHNILRVCGLGRTSPTYLQYNHKAVPQTNRMHVILCLWNGSRPTPADRQSTLMTMELALSTEDVSSEAR